MKSLALKIVIGAALASGFAATTKQGGKLVTGMSTSIVKTQQDLGRIDTFRKLKTNGVKAEAAWQSAEKRVASLAREIKNTEKPTKKMTADFAAAKREAAAGKAAFNRQSQSLQTLRTSMTAAGQSTRGLSQQNRDLNRTYEQLNRQQIRMDQLTAARDANLQRRGELRGKMMGAAALATTVGAPVVMAQRFESNMADVKKVVKFDEGQLGVQQVKEMRSEILQMSTELPMAASGITNIIASAGRAGIARDELKGFAQDAIRMSIAFDMSAEEAGGAMTGMRSIFGLTQTDVVKLGDSINFLDNNMDATAAGILRVSDRTGSMAKLFGLTGQQNAALASTFLALKTPPQVASTAMNAMMLKMAAADKQGAKFQEGLESIGWQASELKQAIEDDAQGALISFLEDVNKSEDKIGVLTDLFGLEYADDIAKLSGGLDMYKGALGLVADETKYAGSMTEEFRARAATSANGMVLLRNRATRLGGNLGTVLLPAVNAIVGGIGFVVDILAAATERFPLLTTVLVTAAAALVTLRVVTLAHAYAMTFLKGAWLGAKLQLVALRGWVIATNLSMRGLNVTALVTAARFRLLAAGGMIKAFAGSLLTLARLAIPAVITGMRALTIAMLFNPIGLIITGIALGAALIIKFWKPISGFFKAMWGKVSGPATAAFGVLKTLFKWSPLGLLSRGIGAGARFIGSVFKSPSNAVKGIWTGFKTVFRWSPMGLLMRGMGAGARFISNVFTSPGRAVKGVWAGFKKVMSWSPVGLVMRGWSSLPDVYKSLFAKVKNIAKLAMDGLKDFLLGPVKLIEGLWNKLKGIGGKVKKVAAVTVVTTTAAAGAGATPPRPPSDFPPPPPASAPAIAARPDIQPSDVARPSQTIPAPAAITAKVGDTHLHLTLNHVYGDADALAQQLRPVLERMLREAKDANLHD